MQLVTTMRPSTRARAREILNRAFERQYLLDQRAKLLDREFDNQDIGSVVRVALAS